MLGPLYCPFPHGVEAMMVLSIAQPDNKKGAPNAPCRRLSEYALHG